MYFQKKLVAGGDAYTGDKSSLSSNYFLSVLPFIINHCKPLWLSRVFDKHWCILSLIKLAITEYFDNGKSDSSCARIVSANLKRLYSLSNTAFFLPEITQDSRELLNLINLKVWWLFNPGEFSPSQKSIKNWFKHNWFRVKYLRDKTKFCHSRYKYC